MKSKLISSSIIFVATAFILLSCDTSNESKSKSMEVYFDQNSTLTINLETYEFIDKFILTNERKNKKSDYALFKTLLRSQTCRFTENSNLDKPDLFITAYSFEP